MSASALPSAVATASNDPSIPNKTSISPRGMPAPSDHARRASATLWATTLLSTSAPCCLGGNRFNRHCSAKNFSFIWILSGRMESMVVRRWLWREATSDTRKMREDPMAELLPVPFPPPAEPHRGDANALCATFRKDAGRVICLRRRSLCGGPRTKNMAVLRNVSRKVFNASMVGSSFNGLKFFFLLFAAAAALVSIQSSPGLPPPPPPRPASSFHRRSISSILSASKT
mmetsp:Transcript_19011/g.54777  ORF Transcript_19011/g.54777 Transcript_19011/m.54777 type:complete len:229 (-) Transcript_19011:25-711(-)